jgi:hypothetical protein
MDRGRMVKRGGGYERVEVRRGEVRKWTDVPLQFSPIPEVLFFVHVKSISSHGFFECVYLGACCFC